MGLNVKPQCQRAGELTMYSSVPVSFMEAAHKETNSTYKKAKDKKNPPKDEEAKQIYVLEHLQQSDKDKGRT